MQTMQVLPEEVGNDLSIIKINLAEILFSGTE